MSSNMNRRPWLFLRTPPSPRTPSVTRMPLTLGGHTIPVGWNWTNSMSMSSAPASKASVWPSPVYSQLLLVILKARPTPPVARTTAFPRNSLNRPRSRSYPNAPTTRSPSLSSVTIVHMECTIVTLLKDGERVVGAFGYERERGRFRLFRGKAVVLATGGVGRAFKITSNSWDYTGDGHTLAFDAGAELMDMEFVQFHPTGMVWPPSVRGILVTEGVRGEGGVLKNSQGERFMFRYMPDMFKGDFAETEAESDAWVKGDRKKNRRPPELLTRDVVAKAITKEIAEGRGSEHGGVLLDIASKQSPDYIKKKLPSMYHQFKELAHVDITKHPMEIGPTIHYVMGGVKVDPETQESTVPGLYAAGEVGGGMHGANRLGGNSLSDLLVFGRRAGQHAAGKRGNPPAIPDAEVEQTMREALEPFERDGENPFAVQSALQAVMQRDAGIIRDKAGLENALEELEKLKARAGKVGVPGSREYNPGWHTAIDLHSLVIVSEATARAALERTESRGGHTRSDYPDSDEKQARELIVIKKDGDRMAVRREPQPPIPAEFMALIKEGN